MAQALRAQCDVAACSRAARVLVTFEHGQQTAYCYFHGLDRHDKPRWKPQQIRSIQLID